MDATGHEEEGEEVMNGVCANCSNEEKLDYLHPATDENNHPIYYCYQCNRDLIEFYPPADTLNINEKIALHRNLFSMADMTMKSLRARVTTHAARMVRNDV
jgi:hypothetical protein